MIRVLILAYDFPPYVSVGGLRPFSWFKHFKEFDVEPIVITRQWGNTYGNNLDFVAPGWSKECVIEESLEGTIIRTPYTPNLSNRLLLRFGEKRFRWLRKVISAYYEVQQFFFIVGPKKEIYKAAKSYLNQQKVDVIIATGEPFVLFHYAHKLGATYNLPWIADYRDPWTPNLKNQNWLIKNFYSILENRISSKAKLITTVSSFVETQIQKQVANAKFSIIPNGFDDQAMKLIENLEQDREMLRIGFVGTIYEWHPLIGIIETMNRWVAKFPDRKIELHFYGTNKNEFISRLVKNQYPKLIDAVVTHPKLPNQQLLEKLASHNVLLLFNYYAFMGTKIYDYLGLKRKILFCFTDDPESIELKNRYYPLDVKGASESMQKELIIKSNAGILVSNADELIEVLNDLYHEHKETGEIKCHSSGVAQFSRRIQVERLANQIKNMH
ncbi:MAG: hypothetical protein RL365_942 [Bacteroidota bacterium]|jgi:hypothetical protein